ncbi:cytochrome P450 [Phaeosphaeriaceae sp. SRC1lsM3a]|nr:cytochrome P450 [Stagonospora sp. SRC1lsM3a]
MAQSPLTFIAAGVLLSYFLYTRITLYLARQRMKKEHGCKPCTTVFNKDPIFGSDVMRMMMRNSKKRIMLQENQKRFETLGTNTFWTRGVTLPIIATCEPENVKTILSLKFKDYSFGNRQTAFTPLLGHGIFNADGERWANSRHMLRPNFARDQVADIEAFERHFQLMLKHIPKDGSTVDLQALFFRLTIDTATEFLFNHSTNSLRMVGQEDESNEDVIFSKAFNFAQEDITMRLRLGVFDRFRNNTKGEEAIQICHRYIERFVDDALEFRKQLDKEKLSGAKDEKYYFIQEVAKQTTDKKRIRDELINILLAGRDTTASLLSNMFFQLAKKPEIYAKLREEIASLGGRTPSYEELRNFKYLKWCLNESLRTHPVVPGNSRFAIRDTVLPLGGGPNGQHPLFVPKGTMVGYSPYVMHRRKDIYGADANEYKPERWADLRPTWEYLPFNGGPRVCLGQQYALTEASYVTVRLVQEFSKIESRDPEPWIEGLTLTLCSYNGVKVGVTPA